jgi:hypothetical protein
VLKWHDPRLMHYPASVATTWQTSFAQLQPPARALLERLAWLAPDPIPESLLEVPIPDLATDEGDPTEASPNWRPTPSSPAPRSAGVQRASAWSRR